MQKSFASSLLPDVPLGVLLVLAVRVTFVVPSAAVTTVVTVVVDPSLFFVDVVLTEVVEPSAFVVVGGGVEVVDDDVDLIGLVPDPIQIGIPEESTPACTVPPGHLPCESADVDKLAGSEPAGTVSLAAVGAVPASETVPADSPEYFQ